MKRLYLYGPPASGKSWRAKAISMQTGLDYIDLDQKIVEHEGCSIQEIFAKCGEAVFRDVESEMLKTADAPIIALGGGALLRDSNREFAEQNGLVVVLDVDEETIASRIRHESSIRPLGDMSAERKAHYASFAHHATEDDEILMPGLLSGKVKPPISKSHMHRLLIAEFLAGKNVDQIEILDDSCEDVNATLRCLRALHHRNSQSCVSLDCGESGSTLRFLAPIVAALKTKARFIRQGHLAERPMIDYGDHLEPGLHEICGDVSSQYVTGLLFALPLLNGDSIIHFTTPLQSRGYVEMTLDVLHQYGIKVVELDDGFAISGNQHFVSQDHVTAELDWSGASFWLAANAIGSSIEVEGLSQNSHQPDRVMCTLIEKLKNGQDVDVSGSPDCYPALAIVAHTLRSKSKFIGTERLRIKESDRLAAMEEVFRMPCDVDPMNDHRIAMAAAILASVANSPSIIHDASCVKKSYPQFWNEFYRLQRHSRIS